MRAKPRLSPTVYSCTGLTTGDWTSPSHAAGEEGSVVLCGDSVMSRKENCEEQGVGRCRVVVVGGEGVGKSALVRRFTNGVFVEVICLSLKMLKYWLGYPAIIQVISSQISCFPKIQKLLTT